MHTYGLQRDACLYYSLGGHPDWGFVLVPALICRRWENGQIHPISQDYADMWGWEELSRTVGLCQPRAGDVERLYDSVLRVHEIENRFFREYGLQVFCCTNPSDSFRIFCAEKAAQFKDRFHH